MHHAVDCLYVPIIPCNKYNGIFVDTLGVIFCWCN